MFGILKHEKGSPCLQGISDLVGKTEIKISYLQYNMTLSEMCMKCFWNKAKRDQSCQGDGRKLGMDTGEGIRHSLGLGGWLEVPSWAKEGKWQTKGRDQHQIRHGGLDLEAVLSRQPVIPSVAGSLGAECLSTGLTGSQLRQASTPCQEFLFCKNPEVSNQGGYIIRCAFKN